MSNSIPTVMISSTYYDLRQIRKDLQVFLSDQIGYSVLLSEHFSFPIDPDVDTIENCRRRVEQNADMLVLIIGGCYGYVEENSSKSVTNLEYLAARSKGIPIYAFIEKSVLALLPVWEKSPSADFSSSVNDTRVFDFIKEVRSIHKVWTHEFENAQDITKTLKAQFAYLMREGLVWRGKFANPDSKRISEKIQGKSLRLALEKPEAWEYRLFAQVLTDEIEKLNDVRQEYRLGLRFGVSGQKRLEVEETFPRLRARMAEVTRLIEG